MAKRIAVIEREKCINGRGCTFICGNVCPVNRAGKECIIPNPDDNKPIIDESLCIGCGICVNRCPVQCISVINLPEELDKDLLGETRAFQFGSLSLTDEPSRSATRAAIGIAPRPGEDVRRL